MQTSGIITVKNPFGSVTMLPKAKKKQQIKVPPNEKKDQKQSVTDAGREPPAD
jgi:hypothetical protein